jgi:hypothetical protein
MQSPSGGATPTTLRNIWFAFMLAPVVYVVLSWFVTREQAGRALPMPLTAVLALAAVATVVVGYVLPDLVARRRRGDGAGAGTPLDIYQTAMIVRWACFEAVAIYGFVLAIVSLQMLPALVGSVIALALIASSRPRPDALA